MTPWTILRLVLAQLPGITVTFVILSLLYTVYLLPQAKKEGKNAYIAELAVADAKNEAVSKNNLSELQNMSDYDFCKQSLTRRRMPTDVCEQLLGVGKE